MRKNARSPSLILRSAGEEMQSLLARVRFLQQIQQALPAVIGRTGAEHVGVADLFEGRLLLIADSGAWATRLKYQKEQISRVLAQQLRANVDEITVRVRPPAAPPVPRTYRPRRLTPAARRQIRQTASHVSDPGLAEALGRLAAAGPGD